MPGKEAGVQKLHLARVWACTENLFSFRICQEATCMRCSLQYANANDSLPATKKYSTPCAVPPSSFPISCWQSGLQNSPMGMHANVSHQLPNANEVVHTVLTLSLTGSKSDPLMAAPRKKSDHSRMSGWLGWNLGQATGCKGTTVCPQSKSPENNPPPQKESPPPPPRKGPGPTDPKAISHWQFAQALNHPQEPQQLQDPSLQMPVPCSMVAFSSNCRSSKRMGSCIFCGGKGNVGAKWADPKARPPKKVRPPFGPRTGWTESKGLGLTFAGFAMEDIIGDNT